MLDRTSYHQRLIQMLDGNDDALAPWLADPAQADRLRVYRNNVVTAWADTIVKNYPAVERLVGTDFMRGAAIAFIKAEPPKSPVLTMYGEGFAEFLKTFAPAQSLSYLPDVARLDRAWTESFFAADISPLTPSALGGLEETEIAALRLIVHPSVRLTSSQWNAHEIWKANRGAGDVPRVALKQTRTRAMIWWSPSGMGDRPLSSDEFAFLSRLSDGASLGDALSAVPADRQNVLLTFFSEALARGVFCQPKE